jgi:hypothetical protein
MELIPSLYSNLIQISIKCYVHRGEMTPQINMTLRTTLLTTRICTIMGTRSSWVSLRIGTMASLSGKVPLKISRTMSKFQVGMFCLLVVLN